MKRGMVRILLNLLGWSVILLLLFLLTYAVLSPRLAGTLASMLSQEMRTEIEIDDVSLRPNQIHIEGIEIKGPPGSILPHALVVESTRLNAPLTRYLSNHIVIEEILLDEVSLGLEFDSASSARGNWTTLIAQLRTSSLKNRISKRSLLIKKLIITNLQVDVVYRRGDQQIHKLPLIAKMELDNISSDEGLPMNQILQSVLGQMLLETFQRENLNNMLQEVIDTPVETLDLFIQPFKGLLP